MLWLMCSIIRAQSDSDVASYTHYFPNGVFDDELNHSSLASPFYYPILLNRP